MSTTNWHGQVITQLEAIAADLGGGATPQAKPTANFVIAGVGTGTIPSGAKYAIFAISPGGTGTIQGTPYTDEIEEIPFPALVSGYEAIAYEVTAGSLYITYAI